MSATTVERPDGAVIGWIDGEPIGRDELDRRLHRLAAGPRRGLLPRPGSSEHRQVVRWLAQVVLTEQLCDRATRGRPAWIGTTLDPVAAAQLGSITAAAWLAHPAVAALFAQTTPPRTLPTGPPVREFHVRHATAATAAALATTPLASIGWTTGADLPPELGVGLRVGARIGPVRTATGWHRAEVDGVRESTPATASPAATDLRAFARLLDRLRAASIRTAPGFEHPADPAQPDHTHRH